MTVIITIIIIGVLVFVHELGHFIAARRIGIPVYEFSIGFGYRLLSWKKNGVEYSLRILPLGGFVRMAGEEPGDEEDPDGLNRRTPLEKIRVSFAGPFMNFVLAVLIYIYCYAFIGIPDVSNEPVIGKVISGQAADKAGIQVGDRVLSVDNKDVDTWTDFTGILQNTRAGSSIPIEISRDGNTLQLEVIPEENAAGAGPIIGVLSQVTYQKQDLFTAVKFGFQQTYVLTVALLGGLGQLITGAVSTADLAGPIGIASLVGEVAQVGTIFLLSFSAFLSINLGILNLLPIPALDGSRIVFAIVEAIRRKPIEPEKEGFIHWVGFLLLMVLLVVVTYNDILRLFTR